MVLWEIALATACFLGIKRTHRLVLRLQRRTISRHRFPRLRGFLQRRTRNVFDVALTVHKNIQKRDTELRRSIRNRVLPFLNRMKPSAANIVGSTPAVEIGTASAETANASSARHSLSDSVSKSCGPGKEVKEPNCRDFCISKANGGHLSRLSSLRQGTFTGLATKLSQAAIKSSQMMPRRMSWPHVRYISSFPMISKLPPTGVSRQVFREDIALWMRL